MAGKLIRARAMSWDYFDRLPPFAVRLLAKRGYKHVLTSDEIAAASKLPVTRVLQISLQETWDDISVPEARQFLKGCNLDFTDSKAMRRVRVYLKGKDGKRPTYSYLKKSPEYPTLFAPVLARLKAAK